jgi:hypothetical protein
VASRLVNNLRAGAPARTYEDLQHCRVLLVSVPRERTAGVLAELAASRIEWRRKTVALWDSPMASNEMEPLVSRGAHTATLNPVHEAEPRMIVVEGHRIAVRHCRELLEGPHTRLLEIAPQWKALFGAGLTFATSLYVPLVHCCFEAMRQAGLRPLEAEAVADALLARSLRGYRKAGRKSWTGVVATRDRERAVREIAALAHLHPAMANFYSCAARSASALWGQDTAWLDGNGGTCLPPPRI